MNFICWLWGHNPEIIETGEPCQRCGEPIDTIFTPVGINLKVVIAEFFYHLAEFVLNS